MSSPDALNRADADPGRLGHRGCGGGPAKVKATTRSATPGPKGGMRDGRVLSHHSPAMPSAPNRSCQRQMTVLAFSIRRMISVVPWPSEVNRTIFARQTCFWGLFRLATTASNARRSAPLISLLRETTLRYLVGVPASYLALAGRVCIAPAVGLTHGHVLFPKKAGFEVRYIEFGIVKPPGVLCHR
jgi:hypothetical protein